MIKKLLIKELKLSASPLTFFFVLFGFLTLAPGYPVLLGCFFITFGIFQSFGASRENGDILYTALLPVSKSDVVKAKFYFCIFIESCGFLLTVILTLIRMTALKNVTAYRQNALMNANFVFLGFALLIFGLFNLIFVSGYFKTAYKFAKPFITYIIAVFLVIGVAETLHHIPTLKAMNSFGFDNILLQITALATGFILYILLTFLALKKSVKNFEKIDI